MTGLNPLGFCRALRDEGVAVPVSATLQFHLGLQAFATLQRDDLYWVGRSTLLPRIDELPLFDSVFASYFAGGSERYAAIELEQLIAVEDDDADDADHQANDDDEHGDSSTHRTLRYSTVEQFGDLDFAAMSATERAEANRVIDRMAATPPLRRAASWAPTRARNGSIDLRRTVAGANRHGGEIVDLAIRRHRTSRRRVVFLVDISGSMAQYSRALLRFAHAVMRAGVPCDVFTLGTQVTRLSRQLAERDPDRALEQSAGAVSDWAGGTRLGSGLRDFCDRWGQRGVARGAAVVVLSDGWDRGDPELLGAQMQRLARLSYRLIWVNPLKATDGYEPLAVGMAAALPYCDAFMNGHSLHALEDLAVALGKVVVAAPGRR